MVANGVTTGQYRYDHQGRRIQKTEGSTTTNYLYDGQNLYAEYPGSSWATPNAVYVQAGLDHPLARLTGQVNLPTATAAYYHQDGLSSVLAMTNAAKAITATQRFDAFGSKIGGANSVPQYGYTGREPDTSGLIYYRARYYDPNQTRFTQRDPLGYTDGLNQYTYVHNNPVNFNDPNGLLAQSVRTWAQTDGISYVNTALNAVTPASNAFQQTSANYQAGNYTNAAIWGVQGGLEIAAAAVTGGESQVVKGLISKNTSSILDNVLESGIGFNNKQQLRSAMSPGPGEQIHHIVEQTPSNIVNFGAKAIHNTANAVPVAADVHIGSGSISAYYSSKIFDISGDQTIRQWLSGQSFDAQYQFGLKTLSQFGVLP